MTITEYEAIINQSGQLLSPERFNKFLELVADEDIE